MKNNWNLIVEEYAKMVGETGDIYHRKYLNPVVFKMLGSVKNKKILDLACGQGYFSRKLAKKGAIMTGIDSSDKLLDIAKQKELFANQGIEYLLLNSERLNLIKDGAFDLIVSNVSFHDIKNISKVMLECGRVLRQNGKIIFTIPHPITDFAKKENCANGMKNIMKNYLTETRKPHRFSEQLPAYHRSIGFYMSNLFKAGFLVSDFKEIRAFLNGGEKIKERKILNFKREFPTFLIIEGIKIRNIDKKQN